MYRRKARRTRKQQAHPTVRRFRRRQPADRPQQRKPGKNTERLRPLRKRIARRQNGRRHPARPISQQPERQRDGRSRPQRMAQKPGAARRLGNLPTRIRQTRRRRPQPGSRLLRRKPARHRLGGKTRPRNQPPAARLHRLNRNPRTGRPSENHRCLAARTRPDCQQPNHRCLPSCRRPRQPA